MAKRSEKVRGKLFIVSAPSGAGKTTLCHALSRILKNIKHSVSYTTRSPRRGEINNVHYTFVTKNKFKEMIRKGVFAEWAVVHCNLYGTSVKRLQSLIKAGYDIILDIDTHGAHQMRRKFRDAVYIFILPPSFKALKDRLKGRMSEPDEEIRKRLKRAKEEIASHKDYDYVIINDKFSKALRALESIVIAEKHRVYPQISQKKCI